MFFFFGRAISHSAIPVLAQDPTEPVTFAIADWIHQLRLSRIPQIKYTSTACQVLLVVVVWVRQVPLIAQSVVLHLLFLVAIRTPWKSPELFEQQSDLQKNVMGDAHIIFVIPLTVSQSTTQLTINHAFKLINQSENYSLCHQSFNQWVRSLNRSFEWSTIK